MAQLIDVVLAGGAVAHNKLLKFTVTFSEPVTGFDAGDLIVRSTGNLTGATVSSITAVPGSGGASYTVTLKAGVGTGTVSLGVAGDIPDLTGGDAFVPRFHLASFLPTQSPGGAFGEFVVGDFDGDGKLDMLASKAGGDAHQVAFIKGHGDGSFDLPRDIITSTTTGDQIDVGDVDGDGLADLAVLGTRFSEFGPATSHLKVLHGNGDGTFTLTSDTQSFTSTSSLTLRDLNGDGRADLVYLRGTSDEDPIVFGLAVRLSDANGLPGPETSFVLPDQGNGFAIADLNGDGKLDAAVATRAGYSVLLGDGDGTFQAALNSTISGGLGAIAAGDVNGDGEIDLLVRKSQGGVAAVLLGNGDGTFHQSQELPAAGTQGAFMLEDMNGDGRLDLLSAGMMYINNGAAFQPGVELRGSPAAIGDFDNNGTPDIAIVSPASPGTPSGTSIYTQTSPAYRLTTPDDFDGDGRSDILWRNASGTTDIWEMNGVARIGGGNTASQAGNAWKIQGIGDFNGDGHSDIFWRNDSGSTAIWLLDGTQDAGQRFASAKTAWKVQDIADFNNDGTSDILWRNIDGTTSIWLMKDGQPYGGGNTNAQAGAIWKVLAAGDFDGDGNADILLRNDNGTTHIWLMNGSQQQAGSGNTVPQLGLNWTFQDLGDFNGDGKDDILWRNGDGTTQIWFMDGKNQIGGGNTSSQTSNLWQVEKTGDYNGDGHADILWRHDNGSTFVWLMDGINHVGGGYIEPQKPSDWLIF